MSSESIRLKKAIGPLGLGLIIFNCTVGGGIFRLPGEIYEMAGPQAPFAYLLCGLATILVALTFVKVGSSESESGGPYAYVERELGALPGFVTGFLLLLLGTFAMASVANAMVESVFVLFPAIKNTLSRVILLTSIVGFIGLKNCRGVEVGSRIISLATVLKLVPLLFLIGVGLFTSTDNITALTPNLSSSSSVSMFSILRSAMLLMFAFMGIESALTPSGEIKDSKKTLARGIFLGLSSVLVLYLGLQLVAQQTLGSEIIAFKDVPLSAAAEKLMGSFGKSLLLVGAVFSMYGYLSGMMLGIPRILYKMGKDRVFPSALGRIDRRSLTPNNAILSLALIVSALAISGSFKSLAMLANLSAVLMYVICSVAAIKMKPRKPLIPVLTILTLSTLLYGVKAEEYLSVLIASCIAMIVFVIRKRKRLIPAQA